MSGQKFHIVASNDRNQHLEESQEDPLIHTLKKGDRILAPTLCSSGHKDPN